MNEILKAAKLDFYMVRPYLKSFVTSFLIATALVFFNRSITFGVVFTTIISTMFIVYPFSISEKNGIEKMHGILPISKKQLVLGRYIFTCAVGLFVPLFSTVVYSVILSLLGDAVSLPEICMAVIMGFALFGFYAVIELPSFYKYGALKGKVAAYIPMIGYVVVAFVYIQTGFTEGKVISFILENPIVIAVAVVLVYIIAYWISIHLSIRALQKKEIV